MVMRYLGGVNSPSYNPLAANVTTGTTVVQDGGVYTVASAAQANGRTQWVNDPFFSSDTILLQADNFANASQNNTFLDSSQNNFTVTRAGNATQGAFNPFSQPDGYWSNYFDGTGDYFNVIGSSNLAFGTNNFTIEAWVYFTSTANQQIIYDARPASTSGAYAVIYLPSASGKIGYYVSSADRILSDNPAVLYTWTHVAISRVSGTTRMFINGVAQTQTYADTTTYLNGANRPAVGVYGDVQNAGYMTGYISNLRVLNGTGLYTTSFTPSTAPLTAITNTQLLTCQSNRIVDNSANNFAVTKVGDTSVSLFTPFNSPVPGQYPAIQWGASMSFNGSNQYLTLPNNAAFSFGTGDFTIEAFVYNAATPAVYNSIIDTRNADGFTPYIFGINSTLKLDFLYGNSAGQRLTSAASIANNVWTHVAVTRTSGVIRLFINGVVDVNTVTYNSAMTISDIPAIGAGRGGVTGAINGYYLNGFLSNFRLIKGTSLYTSNFTPSTQPLTAVTNTQLLTCQGSAVDSSTNNFTITNNNAVTASTSGPFTIPGSTGSMYFDGTGDYLTVGGNSNLAFGTSDFSIECWVYLTAMPVANQIIYDGRASGGTSTLAPALYVASTTNVLSYFTNNAVRITGTKALTVGQWNYIVLSRVSGVTKMFLNGTQDGSNYTDANVYINGASRPVIAAAGDSTGAGPVNGYISNLRVLKGTGVTTAPVPTTPLTAITNTQLLLNGTNAGIYDASARTAAETVGNAQVTTAIKKYGSGSMAFDGTGDWLLVPNSPDINFGTGDFTVECWLNMTNTTTTRHLIGKGTATTGWAIYFNAAPTLFIFEYAGSISYSSNYNLNTNQWYHLAVVRSGTGSNNFKMFINGFLIHEATITNNLTTTSNMYVGASRTATNSMFGYIDDLRISKFARYTGPFIPPAVAMQDQG